MKLEVTYKPDPFDNRKQLQHLEVGQVFNYKGIKYIKVEHPSYVNNIPILCLHDFTVKSLSHDTLVEPLRADMNIYENTKA